jgi:hypothetical protein
VQHCLVGSEMCIRDRCYGWRSTFTDYFGFDWRLWGCWWNG